MKIKEAQRELESSLFILKHHFKFTWTDKSFEALYFLIRLAKKRRKAAGK